jgi:4-carboxymuconolactone decarboxylase
MKSLEAADDFQMPLQDMVTRICFGEVWSRPELPLKLRSMLTLAILAGQSRPDQLKNHVKGAIANGVSKEEIREILLHATIYVGLPAGSDSWRHATAALKEIGAY